MNVKHTISLLMLAVISSGCHTLTKTETVNVPVAIYVPCPVVMPEKFEACIPPDESNTEWLRCLMVDHKNLQGYALALEAQLTVCRE